MSAPASRPSPSRPPRSHPPRDFDPTEPEPDDSSVPAEELDFDRLGLEPLLRTVVRRR